MVQSLTAKEVKIEPPLLYESERKKRPPESGRSARCEQSAVDVAKRFSEFGADVIHARIEGFHHHQTKELARIGHDQIVWIFGVVLDGPCDAKSKHFLEKSFVEINAMYFSEILARQTR